jgi:hypothetical protein
LVWIAHKGMDEGKKEKNPDLMPPNAVSDLSYFLKSI